MNSSPHTKPRGAKWATPQAFIWAGICFILGGTLGVFVRRWQGPASTPIAAGSTPRSAEAAAGLGEVTPDRLKHMADKQAQLLLAQLKATPSDPELLAKLGYIYYATRNFKEASTYFKRSVAIKDDARIRTELGRAYFYAGEAEEALAEFEKVLKSDPDNANALFNVGLIQWQSKLNPAGALAAWQQLLEKHPHHPRRTEVERLIALARQHRTLRQPRKTEKPAI